MRRFSLPASMGAVLVALSLVYAGCTQGEKLTASEIVSSVEVTPKTVSLAPGRTAQMSGRAFDEGGSQLSIPLEWASASNGIATVSRSGLVTAISVGTTQVTGASGDNSDFATVTVALTPVATVAVTPTAPTVTVNQTVQLTATTRDAAGATLTGRAVTWESSADGIASVSATGLVRGIASGSAMITARSEGQAGATTVSVLVAPVATVAITPESPTIAVNATVQLVPVLRDVTGAELSGRTVTWETSAGGVTTVSPTGLVTGVGTGSATITARSEGQSGTTVVTVQSAPLAPVATITVTPASPTVLVDGTVQLTATLRAADGTVLTGRTVTWETSAAATATVGSATGLVRGVSAGTATITARSEGKAGSTSVTVQLSPVATVTVTPSTPSILVNGTVQLTATLRDAGGALLTGRVVTWETSSQAIATVSASGLVTGVAVGNATITARSEGKSGSTVVTVQLAPVATITVSPATSTINVGGTQQLTATLRDAQGTVLTGRAVTWETSAAAIATVSASGLVKGVAAGGVTITARSEGQAGTASVTVAAVQPTTGIADPTLLTRATGQRPASGSYGRNLAAGQTYVDPNSGATVLKLTSASVPVSNSGMYHGYSEGGPNISQPWIGAGGETYYTAKVGGWLVDIRYSTLTPSNWRRVNYDGEIGFAFSLNPATPRIAYVITGKRVDRYNTATNVIANTGNWPWIVSATGTGLDWLQSQLNDTWFVAMIQSNHTIVAFRPSDGAQRAFTEGNAGVSIDEPHLDREFPYVYLSTNSNVQNKIVNLETSAYTNPRDTQGINGDDHASPMRGKVVALTWMADGFVSVDYLGNVRATGAVSPSPTDWRGDWHQASQWVFDNPNEYFVVDQWADNGNYPIYLGMIGFVSLAGDVRLVAASDAVGTSYGEGGQPHPTLAPDGKFVMWVTNMNGSGRYDTFIARVPVR